MKKIITKFTLFAVSLLSMFTMMGAPVYAATCTVADRSFFELIPTWYKYLEVDCASGEVQSFEVPGDIWKIGIAVIEILLRVAGMIAFGYTVYGGFKFVLSRGNPGEAAKARQTLIDAVIGIAITSIATILVAFLGKALAA